MKGNDYKAIKSGIWFTISNFLVRSIGLITTPIFTRLLSTSEFGEFNNFLTWTGILLIVTSFNLEASLIRARYEYEKEMDSYVLSMLSLSGISTLILEILGCFFMPTLHKILSMNSMEIRAMFVYLFFSPAVTLFQNAERFKYKYKSTVVTSIFVSIGSSLVSVIFVILFYNKLLGRIIGYILPVALLGTFLYIYYFIKGKRIRTRFWKFALPITLPFIPHLLSLFLLGSMDKVMIKHICSIEDLALYSLAYTIGSLVSILVTSMNNAYSPWLGEQLKNKNYVLIKKISVSYVVLFVYLACGLVLITPEILYIMGGSTYMAAKHIIPPVTAGCMMQFIYCMYVNVEQYEKKTVGMAIASVLAALFNYVTNYIFINIFGYTAAAYTTYFSYLLLLIMHMYLVYRIGKSNVYDNKIIILIALIASLIICGIGSIFEYIVLRYIILFFYCCIGMVVLMKYKKQIISIFRKN
ncbi:MAG: lipopolysaccharide biosynthesis protein [Agathobacter sp.]